MKCNFNYKSDHAINKNSDDITYIFADGQEVHYRKRKGIVYKVVDNMKMIKIPSSEIDEQEFDRIKALSDEDYHEKE